MNLNHPPIARSETSRKFDFPFDRKWTIPAAVELACVLEATAPKIGNVYPGVSFADMCYSDFLISAAAIGPIFERSSQLSVGELVWEGVLATKAKTCINTNLGMLLLFAPLAKAVDKCDSNSQLRSAPLQSAVATVLANLTHADSIAVYEAIRIAKPGGIGERTENDVRDAAPVDLVGAMRQVADVDTVARQYTNAFADVFDRLLPWLDDSLRAGSGILNAICEVQLKWLAEERDGLIVRKCGIAIADEVRTLAQGVVQESDQLKRTKLTEQLDSYLRCDGHRRNPGTTADLIGATLFARLLSSE